MPETPSLVEIQPARYPWLDPSRYSFSLGVEAAGAAWVAGQTAAAHDPQTGKIEVAGDGGQQARLCWDKIHAVLAGTGHPADDLAEVVEYLTPDGLAQRADIEAARPTNRMASIVVAEALVRPSAVVEVEVTAGSPNGLARIPQILPVDDHGDIVAPGDFVGQCRWVLEEAERRLVALGLRLSDVVKTVQQTTPATRSQYRDTAEDRRALLGPAFPASTGILVSALPHPDALVALDVWASSNPKRPVPYAESAYESLTFSPAVAAGDLLFISGTTAWDPSSGQTVAPDDIEGQAEFVYDQIDRICRAAGTSIDRLIKTVEYVTPAGADRYRSVGPVRERRLGRPFPVSSGVIVAGLLGRSWQIEVEAVALLG